MGPKMQQLTVLVVVAVFTFIETYSRIVFPGELETHRISVTNKDPCSDLSNVWCNPTNYPDQKLVDILSKNTSVNQFLDKDGPLISLKVADDYLENICSERTDYIYPKAARNNEGQFMFIVNNPGGSFKHRQLVRVTRCSSPDLQCGQGEVFSSISTSCVQEYSDHKLVALSKTGEELVVDTFSFPSCCVCKIDRSLEF